MSLIIEQLQVGPAQNYVYIVGDNTAKEAVLIDCGWDYIKISDKINSLGLNLISILLTHHHFDHTMAVNDMCKLHNCNVMISQKEADFYKINFETKLKLISEDDKIPIGRKYIEVIETPGHTVGGVCFYIDKNLFTGDTLFINGCGRCDLEGGNPSHLFNSLKKIVARIPHDTIIWPGHNYDTVANSTLKQQLLTNPYLQFNTNNEFIKYRMGYSYNNE